ncbi:MAG: DASS family sodium-coupled anion symporter [Gemmatimonadetes bacterium]|nr:DASS family sodium-coupled anion symporter [Gemmatimonadota bacterium]
MTRSNRIGRLAGVLIFVVILLLPAPEGLTAAAWRTAAVAAWMATWWLSEAVPIPVTALVPLALLPLMGAGGIRDVAAPYANPVIFLFMGGFLVALAMERSDLHRRIALFVLSRVGARQTHLIGGFMAATAFLSMWVSNTAVTLMMLPIALSVVRFAEGGPEGSAPGRFGLALMLGVAYGASVGGVGTLVGTPPNAFLAGFLEETHGIEIGFAEWLRLGLPLVTVALPLVYLTLTRFAVRVTRAEIPGVAEYLDAELEELGPVTAAQRRVGLVFALAAVAWITRPLLERWVPGLSDAGIGIVCGLLLFLIPSGERRGALMDWETAEKLPWGLLILFGGGLSLAAAIDRTELNVWLGSLAAGLADWPPGLFLLLVVVLVVLLTEITSNTATSAAFLPVLAAAAIEIGWDPRALVVPAALAASCAFMLPVATPPNAIVYGSGMVSIREMARAGIWVNALMTMLIAVLAMWLLPTALGVSMP